MRHEYVRHESPIGTLVVVASDRGVCRLSFDERAGLRDAAALGAGPAPLDRVRRALDRYFSGRGEPDLPVDLAGTTPFSRRVLETLRRRVPLGRTISYGGLAHLAGRPGTARAVGQAVGSNPVPILVPCHRVLASDGSLGGFGGGLVLKRRLLEIEGIPAVAGARRRYA